MAAMNRTQREHLLRKLRKMADDALDKAFPEDEEDYDDDKPSPTRLNDNWTVSQLIAAIKSDTVIVRPGEASRKVENLYSPNGWLIPAKGVAILKMEEVKMKERQTVRDRLNKALDEAEDQLIFQDVSGVSNIVEAFELTIKQALTLRK